MKNSIKKAFTLAEMMIVMFIITLCLALTAPIMTKKSTTTSQNTRIPPGAIITYAGAELPKGWFYCDGSEVSRKKYSNLYEVIGEEYGQGDGSTTFNVPDFSMRGLLNVVGPLSNMNMGQQPSPSLNVLIKY